MSRLPAVRERRHPPADLRYPGAGNFIVTATESYNLRREAVLPQKQWTKIARRNEQPLRVTPWILAFWGITATANLLAILYRMFFS